MSRMEDRKQRRVRIKRRYRGAVHGSAERPRLSVYRSLRYVYAQLIDESHAALAATAAFARPAAGR
jgi:large subunit ribosomal protein L18